MRRDIDEGTDALSTDLTLIRSISLFHSIYNSTYFFVLTYISTFQGLYCLNLYAVSPPLLLLSLSHSISLTRYLSLSLSPYLPISFFLTLSFFLSLSLSLSLSHSLSLSLSLSLYLSLSLSFTLTLSLLR